MQYGKGTIAVRRLVSQCGQLLSGRAENQHTKLPSRCFMVTTQAKPMVKRAQDKSRLDRHGGVKVLGGVNKRSIPSSQLGSRPIALERGW